MPSADKTSTEEAPGAPSSESLLSLWGLLSPIVKQTCRAQWKAMSWTIFGSAAAGTIPFLYGFLSAQQLRFAASNPQSEAAQQLALQLLPYDTVVAYTFAALMATVAVAACLSAAHGIAADFEDRALWFFASKPAGLALYLWGRHLGLALLVSATLAPFLCCATLALSILPSVSFEHLLRYALATLVIPPLVGLVLALSFHFIGAATATRTWSRFVGLAGVGGSLLLPTILPGSSLDSLFRLWPSRLLTDWACDLLRGELSLRFALWSSAIAIVYCVSTALGTAHLAERKLGA